jgi:hypothetical protein
MIKGTIHQKNITIVNIYPQNAGASTFIKQKLLDLRVQIDPNTIMVGVFKSHPCQYIGHPDQKKNQQRNFIIKKYYKLNGFKRHLQNIPPSICKIHIFLNRTWNFLQNGSYILT